MASFASTNELIARVGGAARAAQLTTDTGSTPDDARVTEALEGAEGLVTSYLAPRYALDFDTTVHTQAAALLKSLVLDCAVLNLESLRPPVAEDVRKRYSQAMAYLRDLVSGKASLPSISQIPTANSDGTGADVDGPGRVFTHDSMEGL